MEDLDALLDDALDKTSGWGNPSKISVAAQDEPDDELYGDGDVDLDALLDDATEEVFASAPAAATQPPLAPKQQSTIAQPANVPSNPISRTLLQAGLPSSVVARWATTIMSDQAVQARAQPQKPFSRAYKAWSESGYAAKDPSRNEGESADTGDLNDGNPNEVRSVSTKATSLFGETLQSATTKAKFKSTAQANVITAALHGKDADSELVAALQRMYIDQVVRDSVPRLRTDTDRMAATSQEGRFPHIQALLRSER